MRELQSNTRCCCSHFPGNSHTLLLLLLPNALVTITISQGPAKRSSLCHLPAGPCCCWEPNNQALTADPIHCLLLPENTLRILGITACSHWRKRQQIFKHPYQKQIVTPPKNTKGYSCIEVALQDYSLASPNPQKKKNTSKMKKLRNHSQLKEQEYSPKAVNNETDLSSLTDSEFKGR